MKLALVLAFAACSMTATAAFAQAPDTNTSPGPHDPNPPMESPDLRLPPPCTTIPNLAAVTRPVSKPGTGAGQVVPADSTGDTQCSANGITQSAALPGLIPAAQ